MGIIMRKRKCYTGKVKSTGILFDGNEHIIGSWNGQTLYGRFINQTLTTYSDSTNRRAFKYLDSNITHIISGKGYAELPNVNSITCGSCAVNSSMGIDFSIGLLGYGEIDVYTQKSYNLSSVNLQLWIEYLKS